jgi:uncharacterized protein (DUF58 family)
VTSGASSPGAKKKGPLPPELLAQLRSIEIRTQRLATEELSGSYSSVFKGQGLSFREVRAYQAGDDVRWIDWNVSARMNEPFVKVFTEEREMTVMLVVDLSASEQFGTRRASKARVAAEIGALCAFSAIKNNDRVGLIIGTDTIETLVPPKKGDKHVVRVIREILGFEDLETGDVIEIDTSDVGAKDYAALTAAQADARDQAMRRLDLDVVTVRTDRDFVEPLVDYFRMRDLRKGRRR